MNDEQWLRVCGELQRIIGRNSFKNWIERIEFQGVDDGTASFLVPTKFFGDWVNRNYGDKIRSCFESEGIILEHLLFQAEESPVAGIAIDEGAGERPRRHATVNEFESAESSGLPGAPLNSRFTFDQFVVGKPNELAHAAARNVALHDTVNFNPLFLYGGVGLGKTHLMHAIAWKILERNPGSAILYLSAEQFMYRFVQALRDNETMSFKELFRSVDVLLVDDVQFIADKDSTQEEFFHTFNSLVDQKRKIVISADRSPGKIRGLEERIKSRLQSGLVVDIHPPDYELRLNVLRAKSEAQVGVFPNIRLEDGVLEFLAQRISGSVRVLEGGLNRLFAFADCLGQNDNLMIDQKLAQECLSEVLRASASKVTVDEITRKVADHYSVRISDILSHRRARSIVRPRQIAMYFSKNLTTRSLPEIGRYFGGRDHTTVLHAVRKVSELERDDVQFAEDLEILRRMLEG